MLHYFLTPLSDGGDIFNLFRYISFRTGGALLTSLIIFFVAGRRVIDWLRVKQKRGQPIREDGPQSHIIEKAGTPTMGGVLIVGAILISTLLWARLSVGYIWVVMLVTFGYALIGFIDDYLKVTRRTSGGASARVRLLGGALIGVGATIWIAYLSPEALQFRLAPPFFKDVLINLGWFFPVFGMIVIVGSANAVNLTDGLDGLAIVPAMIAILSYGIIAYFVGNAIFADYLALHLVPGVGELTVFVGAMMGAGLGFLWYNAPPAMVFMGDTGSLALGGAVGAIAVMTKHELVLIIIGGLFVLETVSVMIQVASFKLTGKRVFRMAPIHHHFEHKGWKEPTIVIRFWIIAIILALIGLSTLKLR